MQDARQCSFTSELDEYSSGWDQPISLDSARIYRASIDMNIKLVTHSPRASLTRSRGCAMVEFAMSSMVELWMYRVRVGALNRE